MGVSRPVHSHSTPLVPPRVPGDATAMARVGRRLSTVQTPAEPPAQATRAGGRALPHGTSRARGPGGRRGPGRCGLRRAPAGRGRRTATRCSTPSPSRSASCSSSCDPARSGVWTARRSSPTVPCAGLPPTAAWPSAQRNLPRQPPAASSRCSPRGAPAPPRASCRSAASRRAGRDLAPGPPAGAQRGPPPASRPPSKSARSSCATAVSWPGRPAAGSGRRRHAGDLTLSSGARRASAGPPAARMICLDPGSTRLHTLRHPSRVRPTPAALATEAGRPGRTGLLSRLPLA
jgi:hypothetical protein